MPKKAKFGFGSSDKVEQALQDGKINARDIVFLDEDTDNPKVGWVTLDGKIVTAKTDLSEVEAEITNLESTIDKKANTSDVEILESEVAEKANAEEVEAKYEEIKYEITSAPEGTLINYYDHEIRVMCPADTNWTLQNVGSNGLANRYYLTFRAYAPEGAVSFKEDAKTAIEDDTMHYFENNSSAGTDKYGRNYSVIWWSVAEYDESTNTWTYFGAESVSGNYNGKDYSVEWYDADGVCIASDYIRINYTNENCHTAIEPYYVEKMKTEVETMIETKIAEVNSAYEIVEF